jgi:hypothetical protein
MKTPSANPAPSLARGLVALACALACLVGAASAAWANDSSFGGEGAELIPLKETRIRMAAEDIVLEKKERRWHIEATYTFENPTAEVVQLQLGFPERHCDPESDCQDGGGIFKDMKTTARGVELPLKVGTVDPKNEWAPHLGKVFLFDLTFQPKEKVTVVHRYSHAANSSVDGEWVSYVTRTGGLWNGPIGSARFTLRTPEKPWSLRHPKQFKLTSYVERPVGKGKGQTEIIFEMKDWTPKTDLNVLFLRPLGEGYVGGCPDPYYASYDSLGKTTAVEMLQKADDATLVKCRNMVYAHHGYTFKTKELQDFFYGPAKPFYEDEIDVPLQPNPFYSEELLTYEEHQFVALVKAEEERRKKK